MTPWLEAQLKKYGIVFPAQKMCIEQAIKFFPQLDRGLAAAAAAGAPAPSFDSPDEEDEAAPAAVPVPDF